MATGDTADFVRRLRAALPKRWFPDDAPVLTGVLTGFAASWTFLYSLLAYVIAQTRINTATGVLLDLIATDFFRGRITRQTSEPDAHFRLRIETEILRPRATRASVAQALFDLTGVEPVIFEPADTTDTGGYNIGGVGYDVAGGWGDIHLPFQAFITAFRPSGGGIANIAGYGNIAVGITLTAGPGGYNQGAIEWASLDMVQGAITDNDIYSTVAAAMPAATIGWTRGLAASSDQLHITLNPVAGTSRALSSGSAVFVTGSGLALLGKGVSVTTGAMAFATTLAIAASGFSTMAGRLSSQFLTIIGSGTARSFGKGVISGVGLMAVRGKTTASGTGLIAGALGLAARGTSRSKGNLLYGANLILAGRSLTKQAGTAVPVYGLALAAKGTAAGHGTSTILLAGGVVVFGTSRSAGRGTLGAPTFGFGFAASARSTSSGSAVLTAQASPPTAPTGLTASNATPNSIVLTWTASVGPP